MSMVRSPAARSDLRASSRLSFLPSFGTGFLESRCNFHTRHGQWFLLGALLIAGFLPSSILTSQNILKMIRDARLYDNNIFIKDKLEMTGNLVHQVQIERGLSTVYITSGFQEELLPDLQEQRGKVDQAVARLNVWPDDIPDQIEIMASVMSYQAAVRNFRIKVDNRNVTYLENLDFYSATNHVLIQWMKDIIYRRANNGQWTYLYPYHMVTMAMEESGIERARGSVFWNKGMLTHDELKAYVNHEVLGKQFFVEAKIFSALVQERMTSTSLLSLIAVLENMRTIIKNNDSLPSLRNATLWFANMTSFINALMEAQSYLGERIHKASQDAGEESRTGTIRTCLIFIIELFLFPVFAGFSYRMVHRTAKVSSQLGVQTRRLTLEQRRNKRMIMEMFPSQVSDRLLKGEEVPPECYDQATVCFVAISDFDQIITRCQGITAVNVINKIFHLIDDEMIKYDVFKVETVEDMTVVVSGVPNPNGNEHVAQIADMCLNLRSRLATLQLSLGEGEAQSEAHLRFGVCTGPVAAGIVGVKMPRYLLFGDIVNVAARMQSTSIENGIHLAYDSGTLLLELGGYRLSSRSKVKVKGKGEMQTFWLQGRSNGAESRRSLLKTELF